MSSGNQKAISPAAIGEFLSFEHCSRFYKHRVNGVEETENHDQNEFTEAFNPLQTLLSVAGSEFEENVYQSLQAEASETYDLTADDVDTDPTDLDPDHERLFELVNKAVDMSAGADPLVVYQPTLTGQVYQWSIGGHADFIIIWPVADGAEVRVIDAKSAKEEQSHHQIQAAIYILLLQQAIENTSAVDTASVTYSGGVITRNSPFTPTTPEEVPSFDHQTRIDDSLRLLADDGELAAVDNTSFVDSDYQLSSKCASCEYNEACATAAFEESHVKLLGLSESEQALLASHGITSIDDLAELCTEPKDEEWDPTRQKKASFETDEYKTLKSHPGFGSKLPNLVYRAQALQKQLSDTASDTFPAAWVPGTGACELPDDTPPASFEYPHARGTMIRVYLNIQYDHIREHLIQLNGRITATASDTPPQRIATLSDSAPDDDQAATTVEQATLEDFIADLYAAIESVADGFDDDVTASTAPTVHFYTYLSDELTHLIEACGRHDTEAINSLQDLLEGEPGADIRRVSHLKPEIRNRVCLTSPSYGLLHAYDELQPPNDAYSKSRKRDSWAYSPAYASGSMNLRNVFNHQVFNITVDWDNTASGSGVEVHPDDHQQLDGLKTRFRFGAAIPLGYQWSAIDRIDEDWRDDVGIEKTDGTLWYEINSYLFHDHRQRGQRVQPADVEELGRSYCDLLEHVERSLVYRDVGLATNKQPIPLDQLDVDSHEDIPIGVASRQYLRMEHTTQQRETYEQYRKLPAQRVLSGESLPVQITDIDEDAGHGLCVTVSGKLRYDMLYDDAHVERVKRICKQKGNEGTSSGDWMVANPFDYGQTSQAVSEPYEIERGVNATVLGIDMNTDTVEFELRNAYWETGDFESSHRNYTLNEGQAANNDNYTYIEPGGWLILDPLTDSLSADRADKALRNAQSNQLHSLLDALRYGSATALRETPFDESHLRTFSEWLQDTIPPGGYPNDQQAEFITSTDQVTLLQGPPGTGKTAGTVAPSLLARIYAAEEQGTTVSGLITAPSNTAVDEALEATAELLSDVADEDAPGIDPDNIDIVRLTRREPDDPHPNIRFADYNIDDDQMFLSGVHEDLTTERTPGSTAGTSEDVDDSQQTFGAFTDSAGQSSTEDDSSTADDDDRVNHTLVFSTPTKAWGLLKHFTEDDDDPTAIANQELWNLLLIDEASMMTMPRLLLAGVGFQRDGQILVSGDHRQLPPVQKHDWEEENRRSIVETAPYLSGLDYFRLMSGDYDVLHDDTRDAYQGNISPTTNPIPMVQLNTTYRFGPDTADFIQSAVYDQDDIDYTSARSASDINPKHTATADSLKTAYESGEVTLITYDSEQTFQQVNDLERVISMALIQNHHPEESVGIVTPHNAQRGRLRDMLKKLEQSLKQHPNRSNTIELDETGHVETVERFQGGQQDLMVVSATASNPQFIRSENGFLLEENRANVSFTRHEDKLIVIAAQSLLSHIPDDPDIYAEASLWKLLSETVGEVPTANTPPDWSGTLREFVGALTPPDRLAPDETSVSIYGI